MSIGISGAALVRGMFAPTSLEIISPKFKLIRRTDGTIGIDAQGATANPEASRGAAPVPRRGCPEPRRPAGQVQAVRLSETDQHLRRRRLDHRRADHDQSGGCRRFISMSCGTISAFRAMPRATSCAGLEEWPIDATATYGTDRGSIVLQVRFTGIEPAEARRCSARPSGRMAGLEFPVSGTVRAEFKKFGDKPVVHRGFERRRGRAQPAQDPPETASRGSDFVQRRLTSRGKTHHRRQRLRPDRQDELRGRRRARPRQGRRRRQAVRHGAAASLRQSARILARGALARDPQLGRRKYPRRCHRRRPGAGVDRSRRDQERPAAARGDRYRVQFPRHDGRVYAHHAADHARQRPWQADRADAGRLCRYGRHGYRSQAPRRRAPYHRHRHQGRGGGGYRDRGGRPGNDAAQGARQRAPWLSDQIRHTAERRDRPGLDTGEVPVSSGLPARARQDPLRRRVQSRGSDDLRHLRGNRDDRRQAPASGEFRGTAGPGQCHDVRRARWI